MQLKHTLLCVDDEEHNLEALRRSLRKEYNILTATNGPEGLDLLSRNEVSLIISDQRMPQMTGVEFLEKTITMRPNIMRIILTGFTDVDDLIGAINTGRVYRYVTKPWDPNDLKLTVKRALESLELSLENRRLFDDVVRLEKLATVGQVAGGIAHEVRNQLSALMGLQLIQAKYPKDDFVTQVTEQILLARDRIVGILDDVKSYGKQNQEQLQKKFHPAKDLFTETRNIVSLDPDVKRTQLECCDEGCPALYCDKSRIVQVLINLVRNAAHAMAGKGTIRMTAERPGQDTLLRVIDTGCGIPEENLEKIWQPFFTTKGDQGTGLGLQISRRIVEAHEGRLECVSEVGNGTTFTIYLPYRKPSETA